METGERFFAVLVENLAKALKTHGAWVTRSRRVKDASFRGTKLGHSTFRAFCGMAK